MAVTINGDGTITGLSVVPDPGANGVVVRTSSTTATARTITAGTGVSVANGDGVSGNPTITNSGVTAFSAGTTGLTPSTGTTGSVTLAGTLGVANGGTGQTTYTNGQLLIGNTTGNTLAKATLTAGTGVSVTNGAGAITITNTGVTSVTAGTNITVSASTGGVTISAAGGGVTSLNGQTGAIVNTSSNAIGSYAAAYLNNNPTITAFGSTYSGASLFFYNANTETRISIGLSGTWRCLGNFVSFGMNGVYQDAQQSLFVRIS